MSFCNIYLKLSFSHAYTTSYIHFPIYHTTPNVDKVNVNKIHKFYKIFFILHAAPYIYFYDVLIYQHETSYGSTVSWKMLLVGK
jgi:hypothetical protein